MDIGKSRLNIDVESLAKKNVKRRKKRDLNQPVYYEINDKKVPVFSSEFLEANRVVDDELRKLRRLNNDFEEHNSVLTTYIDSLNTSCDQSSKEIKELTQTRDLLKIELDILKAEVKDKYSNAIKSEKE